MGSGKQTKQTTKKAPKVTTTPRQGDTVLYRDRAFGVCPAMVQRVRDDKTGRLDLSVFTPAADGVRYVPDVPPGDDGAMGTWRPR